MSVAGDPLLGRIIAGKMELVELLGAGAMGKVFRAHHRGLDKAVAVKVLHTEAGASPALALRFKAEARAASRLDHPNSLQVLDFGEDGSDKLLYIAMELLEGETLQARLHRERKLPPDRAAWIIGQVCSALAAAHDQGVIHRDVKPANVMLTVRRGDRGLIHDFVKVCDFGLAKVLDSGAESSSSGPLTQQGAVLGTPAYMSPEQAKGETVDHRADVYACGVILYRMLAGRKPFAADSAWAVSLKQISEDPPPIQSIAPELSAKIAAVVHRALQKDPDRRYANARALKAAFATAVGVAESSEASDGLVGATLAEPVPDGLDPTHVPGLERSAEIGRAPGKRTPAKVLAAAGMLVLFATAAGIGLARRSSEPIARPLVDAGKVRAPKPMEPAEITVTVVGAPDGARVLNGGRVLAVLPAPVSLEAGEDPVTLTITADGHEPLERTLVPDRDLHLSVALRPTETPPKETPQRKRGRRPRRRPRTKKRRDRNSLENPFD